MIKGLSHENEKSYTVCADEQNLWNFFGGTVGCFLVQNWNFNKFFILGKEIQIIIDNPLVKFLNVRGYWRPYEKFVCSPQGIDHCRRNSSENLAARFHPVCVNPFPPFPLPFSLFPSNLLLFPFHSLNVSPSKLVDIFSLFSVPSPLAPLPLNLSFVSQTWKFTALDWGFVCNVPFIFHLARSLYLYVWHLPPQVTRLRRRTQFSHQRILTTNS
jgi:hypothetical protein